MLHDQCCHFRSLLVRFVAFVCSYVEKYDLQEPSDDIQHVLKHIAVKLRKTQRVTAITGVGEREHRLQIQPNIGNQKQNVKSA